MRVVAAAGPHHLPPRRPLHLPPPATLLSTAAVTHRPASLLVLPNATAAIAVRRSCYHGASLEALLLRWSPKTAEFDGTGAVALRLDAVEAAAGRRDMRGRPRSEQSRQLLRLARGIPLFDVGIIYLGLLNEAALAALLDNRCTAQWRAAAAALAAPATTSGEPADGDGSTHHPFSVRIQLAGLLPFSSLEWYPAWQHSGAAGSSGRGSANRGWVLSARWRAAAAWIPLPCSRGMPM